MSDACLISSHFKDTYAKILPKLTHARQNDFWKNDSGRKNDSVWLKYYMLKSKMVIILQWYYQFST